ncbi:alkylated DNA repair protein-like protein alkB 6 [Bisporella sp. PMI_857]|nr:alkylated DNA repair protein-like protein alkB 6 [Bisporella sp. PMI_857]
MIPASLHENRIPGLPPTAFYIADFISAEEEHFLLQKIATAPKPRWKQLSKRRLQTWPSDLNKNTLLESPLPQWLVEPIISRLTAISSSVDDDNHIFGNSPHGAPNHVLVNEYLPGQGIMPHKDGPAYHPVVCTVSLGASLCLDIYGNNNDGLPEEKPRWKILQEPRSLLISTGELYTDYLHGISQSMDDVDLNPNTVANWKLLRSTEEITNGRLERRTRTSLTYRDVIKVSKLGTKFAMFGKR